MHCSDTNFADRAELILTYIYIYIYIYIFDDLKELFDILLVRKQMFYV